MFGITAEQIKEQKAKFEEVKVLVSEARTALEAGDVKTCIEKLDAIKTVGKESVKKVKEVVDNVKNTDKEAVKETFKKSLIDSVKSTITKSDVKKNEQTTTQYTDDSKK
jgi:hypothetical protein